MTGVTALTLPKGTTPSGATPSGTSSNLSDPSFAGFDVVTAVTQASVNSIMRQYLDEVDQPLITEYYVYSSDGSIVPISKDDLLCESNGSDPFALPDGTPCTSQDVINLTNARFAGAFKAKIGLPPGVPIADLPDIVTLSQGTNAPVIFNLLCSEFDIVDFQYGPPPSPQVLHKSQLKDDVPLFYFTAHVSLDTSEADLKASGLPVAVQRRIKDLEHSVGPDNFSIQHLLLLLESAVLLTSPNIVGIPKSSPLWLVVQSIFLTAYFDQLKAHGDPVLSYAAQVKVSDPATLQLHSQSLETQAFLVDGKVPAPPSLTQQQLATLIYIGTTMKAPPTPVRFPWNWVLKSDLRSISGVMSVILSHSGENIHWEYKYATYNSGPTFIALPTPKPSTDGFTTVATYSFPHPSTDSTHDALNLEYFYATFSSTIQGTVEVKGNVIRVIVNAVVHIEFHHHEAGVHYNDLSGENWVNLSNVTDYTLGVTSDSKLTATHNTNFINNSTPLNWHHQGIEGAIGGLPKSVNGTVVKVIGLLTTAVKTSAQNFSDNIYNWLNDSTGWVFPGSGAYAPSQVFFSDNADLVTHLTYLDPAQDSKHPL